MKQMNQTIKKIVLLIAFFSFSNFIQSQCTANFSMTAGPNGLVTFTSTSTGTLSWTQYSWTFGDGGTGTGLTTSHTYTSNGWKKVCLTINNFSPACTSSKCDSINVTSVSSSSVCQAAFTPSGCVNGTVQFFSTSTGTGNFTKFSWTFGDGGTSILKNPSHTYTANGVYNVCLNIKDSTSGCNSTKCMTVNVNCITSSSACAAAFSYSGCANGLVQFYSTSTGTGTNTTYKWTFGDGGQAFTKNTSHTYTANGVYNVCLTIKDSTSNCNSTKCMTVNVNCVQSSSCLASFASYSCAAGTVWFSSTSTGTTAMTGYTYTFGDGGKAFTKNASHTYTANGIYNVCLTIKDSTGNCMNTACQNITVNCVSTSSICNANFTYSNCVNGVIQFFNTSTGTTGLTQYNWTFGDGGVSTSTNPIHTYTANGVYNVCLTISDSSNNCSNTYCKAVNINCVGNGIKDIASNTGYLKLYPNPNNGAFNISFSDADLNTNYIDVAVYNLLGENVYAGREEVTNGKLSKDIDLTHLASGSYYVRVITGSTVYSVKAVISK